MIFDKSISYDLNPLSMPRLDSNECEVDIKNILVRQVNESTGVVRFSDILDYSKKSNLSISEVTELLSEYYDMGIVAVVNEIKLNSDDDYQLAVLESVNIIPLQIDSLGIDEEFSELLEYCILMDLENGNTEYTDQLFLETGIVSQLDHANNVVSDAKANVIDGVQHYGGQVIGKVGGFLKNIVGAAANKFGNYMDTHDNVATRFINSKIDAGGQKLSNIASDKIDQLVGKGQDWLANKGTTILKDKAQKLTIGAVLGMAAKSLNNLTNQENMTSNNPSVLQRVLNSLKQMYDKLMGHKENTPPQQQNVVQNLLNKCQTAMKNIQAKYKLVGGS